MNRHTNVEVPEITRWHNLNVMCANFRTPKGEILCLIYWRMIYLYAPLENYLLIMLVVVGQGKFITTCIF